MASIEITMRHSDVRIEALKDYAQMRMEKLCEALPNTALSDQSENLDCFSPISFFSASKVSEEKSQDWLWKN